MTARAKATALMTHYIGTVYRAAGLHWTSEHETEIEQIVDAFHQMIRDEIQEHAEDAPHIYPDGSTS